MSVCVCGVCFCFVCLFFLLSSLSTCVSYVLPSAFPLKNETIKEKQLYSLERWSAFLFGFMKRSLLSFWLLSILLLFEDVTVVS